MLSAEIIKQLSSCRSETINWKTQIGNFQFKRSNQSTSYEKMEIKFINQFWEYRPRTIWILRPKDDATDISEDDKENIKVENVDYFDSRGAPAPLPWENREEFRPNFDNLNKMPKALSESELLKICSLILETKNNLELINPIFIPARNSLQFMSKAAFLHFDKSEQKMKLEFIDSYNYLEKTKDGLETHEPSSISLNEVLLEASCMNQSIEHYKNIEKHFSSVYNPFTPTADHCEIQFSWKNRECGNLLQLPIIDDEHRNCRLLISIGQKTYSSKIYQDINEQYLRLGKMLNALNNSSTFPGTDLDTGSIDKLLQTGSLDVTSDVWKICKVGTTSSIFTWINEFLKKIFKGEGKNISIANDNDTDLGNRIQKAQNKRGIIRINEESALAMIVECGERAIQNLLKTVHSPGRHSQIESAVTSIWGTPETVEDQLLPLLIYLKLNCLADALEALGASNTIMVDALSKWLKARKAEKEPLTEIMLKSSFGWEIARHYNPSEWKMRAGNFVLYLQNTPPTDIMRSTGFTQKADQKSSYYLFEKNSQFFV